MRKLIIGLVLVVGLGSIPVAGAVKPPPSGPFELRTCTRVIDMPTGDVLARWCTSRAVGGI